MRLTSVLAMCAIMPLSAFAQETCWVPTAAGIQFGDVDPAVGGYSSTTIDYSCHSESPEDTYFHVCLYINTDAQTGDSYNPRKMTNWVGGYVNYDFFYDAAHTMMITPATIPMPSPSGWTVYIPGVPSGSPGTDVNGSFPFYAYVYPNQLGIPAGSYQGHPAGGEIRYIVSHDPTLPIASPDCSEYTALINFNFGGIYANVSESCHVLAATDMDFGVVANLDEGYSQSSQIRLSCPIGVTWQIGLDDGRHYSGGRRMIHGTGNQYLNYELYQDRGHSIRWGNTLDTDTTSGIGSSREQVLNVYGRVEAQSATSGSYSDKITITLTF